MGAKYAEEKWTIEVLNSIYSTQNAPWGGPKGHWTK